MPRCKFRNQSIRQYGSKLFAISLTNENHQPKLVFSNRDRTRFRLLYLHSISADPVGFDNTRAEVAQQLDFGRHFQELGVEGSIHIYDLNSDRIFQRNPVSTKMIYSSLNDRSTLSRT